MFNEWVYESIGDALSFLSNNAAERFYYSSKIMSVNKSVATPPPPALPAKVHQRGEAPPGHEPRVAAAGVVWRHVSSQHRPEEHEVAESIATIFATPVRVPPSSPASVDLIVRAHAAVKVRARHFDGHEDEDSHRPGTPCWSIEIIATCF